MDQRATRPPTNSSIRHNDFTLAITEGIVNQRDTNTQLVQEYQRDLISLQKERSAPFYPDTSGISADNTHESRRRRAGATRSTVVSGVTGPSASMRGADPARDLETTAVSGKHGRSTSYSMWWLDRKFCV